LKVIYNEQKSRNGGLSGYFREPYLPRLSRGYRRQLFPRLGSGMNV
jgi:hypothetical protein